MNKGKKQNRSALMYTILIPVLLNLSNFFCIKWNNTPVQCTLEQNGATEYINSDIRESEIAVMGVLRRKIEVVIKYF